MTSLRPYQVKARADIYAAYSAGSRAVMLQLITGGGKTVIFVEIIKDFLKAGKRVIMVAHREELITQAWQTLYNKEIYAGVIKSGNPENFTLPCQVASIQTICRRAKLPRADLVIFDEAHHSQDDNSYGDVLTKHFPYARVLGVTATPYRLSGLGFTSIFDKLIQGPTFQELVDMGYLSPLRYFIAHNPDLSKVKVKNGDFVIEELHKAMGMAPLVKSYHEHCDGMAGLVFAVNIPHSQEIVRQYLAAGIPGAHVDANTPADERKKLFQLLRDKKIKILSNVGIATEGTDIPTIDFVQLARPTKSLSLFCQMIGRVTRVSPGKEFGFVLDNGGLYLEHGMPDQAFDWQSHFVGRPKGKKKKVEEMIEIIELVAEDEDGERVISRKPEEVEGLKLIEVRHLPKDRIVNMKSLKEFDKHHAMFQNMKNIPKPGQTAFFKYQDLCKRNSWMMNKEVWDYLIEKLVNDPIEREKNLERVFQITVEAIMRENNQTSAQNLISTAAKLHQERISKIRSSGMPLGFLMKQKSAYFKTLNPEKVND